MGPTHSFNVMDVDSNGFVDLDEVRKAMAAADTDRFTLYRETFQVR